MKFKELDIGDVFRTNLMYFQKKKEKTITSNDSDRRIVVNAGFVSDDHYESGKTDVYVGGADVFVDADRDVEFITDDLRAVKEEKSFI